jgi:hypothetical protein
MIPAGGVFWLGRIVMENPLASWFETRGPAALLTMRVRQTSSRGGANGSRECAPDDAPYWVNYHAEHHLFMYLPCYRLPEAHGLLVEKGFIKRMEVRPSYLDVMRLATSRHA